MCFHQQSWAKIVLYNYIPSDFVMFLQLTLVTVFVLLSFFIIAIAYVQNVLSFQFNCVVTTPKLQMFRIPPESSFMITV